MLEEIKHFFDVPGVVFIWGLHGGQLGRSINAVYGAEFDSDDYLRRFFTRRYELRSHSIVELAASMFQEWGLDENKFVFPRAYVGEGYQQTKPRSVGLVLAQWNVTPRELIAIMDGLRLFLDGWEHPEAIEPLMLLGLLVHLVRGEPLNNASIGSAGELNFDGLAVQASAEPRQAPFNPNQVLANVNPLAWNNLPHIEDERYGPDPARNYIIDWLKAELHSRRTRSPQHSPHQSYLANYIPRLADLARFIDKPEAGE